MKEYPTISDLEIIAALLREGHHKRAFKSVPIWHWPFGVWLISKDTEVLFNRSHVPLWQWHEGQVTVVGNLWDNPDMFTARGRSLESIARKSRYAVQRHFFDYEGPLPYYMQAMKKLRECLTQWGLIVSEWDEFLAQQREPRRKKKALLREQG
jgi:hypothetical protein